MQNIMMLKIKDVIQKTAISKAQIYRKIKAGEFPKPLKQGTRAVAWKLSDIDNFLQNLSN